MSMERCKKCGRHVNTDYDVEGECYANDDDSDWMFICSRCVEKEAAGEEELMQSCHSHTAEE